MQYVDIFFLSFLLSGSIFFYNWPSNSHQITTKSTEAIRSSLADHSFTIFKKIDNEENRNEIRPTTINAFGANGDPLKVSGTLFCTIKIGDFISQHTVLVVEKLGRSCLLGMDVLNIWPTVQPLLQELRSLFQINQRDELIEVMDHTLGADVSNKAILEIVNTLRTVTANSLSDLTTTSAILHEIKLIPNTKPIKQAPRRVPIGINKKFQEKINEMNGTGLIRKSKSDWSSPVRLVGKPDGDLRVTIDYTKLNPNTIKDAYPLPKMDDIIQNLAGAKYFTVLDL